MLAKALLWLLVYFDLAVTELQHGFFVPLNVYRMTRHVTNNWKMTRFSLGEPL